MTNHDDGTLAVVGNCPPGFVLDPGSARDGSVIEVRTAREEEDLPGSSGATWSRELATLTRLALAQAPINEVMKAHWELTRTEVLLVGLDGSVVDSSVGVTDDTLRAWDKHRVPIMAKLGSSATESYDGRSWTWTRIPVGPYARSAIVMVTYAHPTHLEMLVNQHAALALAVASHRDTSVGAQYGPVAGQFFNDLMIGIASEERLGIRARAIGLYAPGRSYAPLVIRPTAPWPIEVFSSFCAQLRAICRRHVQAAVVSQLDSMIVAVVAGSPRELARGMTMAIQALGVETATELEVVMATASPRVLLTDLAQVLREATRLASAVARPDRFRAYRIEDLTVDDAIKAVSESWIMQTFAEQAVGRLVAARPGLSPTLLRVLVEYLQTGRSKARAAERLGISRSNLYDKLGRLERALGVDLADEKTCFGLQVAMAVANCGATTRSGGNVVD